MCGQARFGICSKRALRENEQSYSKGLESSIEAGQSLNDSHVVDLALRDSNGNTALRIAMENSCFDTAEILVVLSVLLKGSLPAPKINFYNFKINLYIF